MQYKEPFIFKTLPYFIGFVFILIICVWGFNMFVMYKAVSSVQSQDYSKGIKPVIEKIWCGESGCLDK